MSRAVMTTGMPKPIHTQADDDNAQFLADVVDGLSSSLKHLPSKYFYDQRGSELFDRICELDEYYPTRTELRITRDNVAEMAKLVGPRCLLVEFGSGSSTKTRILLDHFDDLAGYVPVDVSDTHLAIAAADLARCYLDIPILPVCADFCRKFDLPKAPGPVSRRVVYFPGSTIGNFSNEAALKCLARVVSVCGPGGGLLIGVDLTKDRTTLEAAYNDSEGVTAMFNMNMLVRINRELGANFNLARFEHLAIYNEQATRIESYLVSDGEQVVTIGDEEFSFHDNERISTEYSQKYSVDGFLRVAAKVGLQAKKVWIDDRSLFSVHYLTVPE